MMVTQNYSAFITHLYGIGAIRTALQRKEFLQVEGFNIINTFIRFHCHVNEFMAEKERQTDEALVGDHKSIP